MYYYRQKDTKNVFFSHTRLLVRPKDWTFMGEHKHHNPKMAVVSLVGYHETGFNIKEVELPLNIPA